MHVGKNIDNELIRDVVEPFVKVSDTTFRVLFEDLEFRILLIKLMSNRAADDISEHGFEGLLIAIIILDGHEARTLTFLLTLAVCLLTHNANGLVGSLDGHRLDITHRDAINHCSLLLLGALPLDRHLLLPDLLGGKVAGAAGVGEALVNALSLAHGLVGRDNVLRGELLGRLVGDSLKLLVLHLPGDGLLSVGGHGLLLVFE